MQPHITKPFRSYDTEHWYTLDLVGATQVHVAILFSSCQRRPPHQEHEVGSHAEHLWFGQLVLLAGGGLLAILLVAYVR